MDTGPTRSSIVPGGSSRNSSLSIMPNPLLSVRSSSNLMHAAVRLLWHAPVSSASVNLVPSWLVSFFLSPLLSFFFSSIIGTLAGRRNQDKEGEPPRISSRRLDPRQIFSTFAFDSFQSYLIHLSNSYRSSSPTIFQWIQGIRISSSWLFVAGNLANTSLDACWTSVSITSQDIIQRWDTSGFPCISPPALFALYVHTPCLRSIACSRPIRGCCYNARFTVLLDWNFQLSDFILHRCVVYLIRQRNIGRLISDAREQKTFFKRKIS